MHFPDLYYKHEKFINVLFNEYKENIRASHLPTVYCIGTNLKDIAIRKYLNSIFNTSLKANVTLNNSIDWPDKCNYMPIVDLNMADQNMIHCPHFKVLLNGTCDGIKIGSDINPFKLHVLYVYDDIESKYIQLGTNLMQFANVYIDIYKDGNMVYVTAKSTLNCETEDISLELASELRDQDLLKLIGSKLKIKEAKQVRSFFTLQLKKN